MNPIISGPLVSVGIASYNNEAYIRQTLDSIRNQTYTNWELIIVDDCSTDNSVSVIREWITEYPQLRVTFIIHEKNQGVCRVLNAILESANGNYISTIGSDDIYMPEKLTIQVALLEASSPKVGVVYSDANIIDANDKPYFCRFIQLHRQLMNIPQGNIFPVLLADNYIPVMTSLFRRECFLKCGVFDETLMYEDWDMLLRIAREFDFIFSDYIAAHYRMHTTNASKKLQGLSAAETNFKLLYKQLGVNKECDSIIKRKLRHLLDRMYYLKSNRQREYMEQYYAYFNDEWLFKFALKSGLPYFRLLRLQHIMGRLTGRA